MREVRLVFQRKNRRQSRELFIDSFTSFEEIFIRLLELPGDIVRVLVTAGGDDEGREEAVASGGDSERKSKK